MLASIAFNYWMAIAIHRAGEPGRSGARVLLGVAVAVNLAVLGLFKYANFIADNANAIITAAGGAPLALPGVVLPIGISFFTFHAISYVVDVYRRDAIAQKSPIHAALYLLLFPQLIAGPIIRYRNIADQLARRVVRTDDFALGVRRFVAGLGKKVLIADAVALPADRIFAMPADQLTAGHAWLGIVCYTVQIYFDFSGYSDMALGLGRMFGFRFPENFRWPYIADSVQDFWRRWHISLSAWFRDYLYVPLGGSRVSTARTYLNLATVFFLCGLWHGASWNFVVWGLFHGTFLIVERMRGSAAAGGPRFASQLVRHLYVLLVVMVGWVLFRAPTLAGAMAFLWAMTGLGPSMPTPFAVSWHLTPEVAIALAAGVIGSMPIIPWLARRARHAPPAGLEWASVAALSLILLASVLQMAARSYSPFIYFQF
jgi:alginate O-acetyltransferase complex protein AlgI